MFRQMTVLRLAIFFFLGAVPFQPLLGDDGNGRNIEASNAVSEANRAAAVQEAAAAANRAAAAALENQAKAADATCAS